MRIPLAVTWAALIALAGSLAACSDDSLTEVSFCDQATEALATVEATGALGDDPEAFQDAVHDIRLDFEQADPDADIADDWTTLTQVFIDFDDALSVVDPSDEAAFSAVLSDFSEQSESADVADASDRVSSYVTQNCEL